MKGIEIRKLRNDDISEVVDLWYEASIRAHSFIPNEYWKTNRAMMEHKYLPIAESYVATNGQEILGFASLMEDHLAALFIRPENQGYGIGSLLLDFIKGIRKSLHLRVYSQNRKSIKFYKANDFSLFLESIDEMTGEYEYIMIWDRVLLE